jgi:hypothetical protein
MASVQPVLAVRYASRAIRTSLVVGNARKPFIRFIKPHLIILHLLTLEKLHAIEALEHVIAKVRKRIGALQIADPI